MLLSARRLSARLLWALVLAALASTIACRDDVAPTTVLTATGSRSPTSAELAAWSSSSSSSSQPRFDERLQLLAADVAENDVVAGGTVRVTTTWLVTGELAGRAKPMLVGAIVAATHTGAVSATTTPISSPSSLTTLEWRKGDVVITAIDVAVPVGLGGAARVALGVLDAGRRWRITGNRVVDDVDGLAVVATIAVEAIENGSAIVADDGLPVVQAKRRREAIVVDGSLDERDWRDALVITLGPYRTGAPVPTLATTARLLWDEHALYLAFDVDDDDPFSPYTNNDDPLYDSEALEIFIDADGDKDVYVELQASPTDVRFDAAFAGGARKNMNVRFNHPVEVQHAARAGGYTQEWRIPVAGLLDVPAGEPRVGARWRINLFRLERRRQGDVVTSTEASAWSPVTANDFHALDRFGTLVFTD